MLLFLKSLHGIQESIFFQKMLFLTLYDLSALKYFTSGILTVDCFDIALERVERNCVQLY